MPRLTGVVVAIQQQFAGLQLPIGILWIAGGVAQIVEVGVFRVVNLDTPGSSGTMGVGDPKAGIIEGAALLLQVHLRLVAVDA